MAEKILVIDDDQPVLEMLTDMLLTADYEVVGLSYPDLALEVVAHERPDLILMDIMLPKRSGIEVADQLWVNGFGSTPILAISASTIMIDLAHQTPFFEKVIRKPFDMTRMLDDVRDTLYAHSCTAEPVAAEHAAY